MSDINEITISHLNIRGGGWSWKRNEICSHAESVGAEILCLNETRTELNGDQIPVDFSYVSKCVKQGSGGAAILFHKNIRGVIRSDLVPKQADFAAIELHSTKPHTILLSVYLNPGIDIETHIRHLETVLKKCSAEKKKIIVVGDWNVHLILAGDSHTCGKGKRLKTLMHKYDLNLIHDGSSTFHRANSTGAPLDFFLTNNECLSNSRTHPQLFGFDNLKKYRSLSDHSMISASLKIEIKRKPILSITKIKWSTVSWEDYRNFLKSKDWDFSMWDPDAAAKKLTDNILGSLNDTNPETYQIDPLAKAFWKHSEDLGNLKTIRNRLRNKFRKHPSPLLKSQLADAEKAYRKEILNAKMKYEQKLLSDLADIEFKESKTIFRRLKQLKGEPSKITPHLLKPDGTLTETDDEKCNVMNRNLIDIGLGGRHGEYDENFRKKIVAEVHEKISTLRKLNDERISNGGIKAPTLSSSKQNKVEIREWCTLKNVREIVSKLKIDKACGPDNVTANLIKNGDDFLFSKLAELYNICISYGRVPKIWKMSNVVTLYKGDPNDPALTSSYRPISLTSLVGKIGETFIAETLYDQLENNEFWAKEQLGFRKKRGCTETLMFIHEKWFNVISKSRPHCATVNLVLTDISKAFDRAWRKGIVWKCFNKAHIDGNLLLWIFSYLSDRYQRSNIAGSSSSWLRNDSGIPQGGVVAPLLYLILCNELPEILTSECSMYADDLFIWSELRNDNEQIDQINLDLERVYEWSNRWRLDFHSDKCKWMRINKKKKPPPPPQGQSVRFGSRKLKLVTEAKILGLVFQSNLKFESHVRKLLKYFRKGLQFMKFLTKDFKGPKRDIMDLYFKSVILGKIDFGAVVWTISISKSYEQALNWLYFESARYVVGGFRNTHRYSLLVENGWLPLRFRWNLIRMKMWSKILGSGDKQRLKIYCLNAVRSGLWNTKRSAILKKIHDFLPKIKDIQCNLTIGTPSFKSAITKWFFKSSTILWNEMEQGRQLRSIKSETHKMKHKFDRGPSRFLEVMRAQLRMGWDHLRHTAAHLRPGISNLCPSCNVVESREHYLLECKRFKLQRKPLSELLESFGLDFSVVNLLSYNAQISCARNFEVRNEVDRFLKATKRFENCYFS